MKHPETWMLVHITRRHVGIVDEVGEDAHL